MLKHMTLVSLLFVSSGALGEAKLGDKAPQFTAVDVEGVKRNLSDYAGKWVVLEWFNKHCPFVKKHYESNNMQNIQKKHTEKGVIWLTINSTHKAHKNYVKAEEAKIDAKAAHATAYIEDSDGKIGKAYGAKTTPHMFIINPKQEVVYAGAIDDQPTPNPKEIANAENYINAAFADINGEEPASKSNAQSQSKADAKPRPIAIANTKPYGCSVKYN